MILLSCTGVENKETDNLSSQQLSDSAALLISKGVKDSITINLLDRSIAKDPNVLLRYGMKVEVLNEMGLIDEGLSVFRELEKKGLFKLNPDFFILYGVQYSLLGDSIISNDKWTKALSLLENNQKRMVVDMTLLKRLLSGRKEGDEYFRNILKSFSERDQEELVKVYEFYNDIPDKYIWRGSTPVQRVRQ